METVFKTALQQGLHVLCTPAGSMQITLESSTKIKKRHLLLQLLLYRQLLLWQKDFLEGHIPLGAILLPRPPAADKAKQDTS